jgi:hypothetical protein
MSPDPLGLHDLPDLARDVRDRVVVPPYDEVSRRVRARRVRGAAAGIAAVVFVVGGVAVWQNAATPLTPTSPDPATQEPLPMTDESLWREVVDGTDAHPFETEGTDDGAIAVVWRALEPASPTYALVVREADGTEHGVRLEEPVSLTAVPGGWVGTYSSRAWFIGSDGEWTELDTTAPDRQARAGDVLVRSEYASWLYSPDDRSLAGVSLSPGADGYVTPDGRLATCNWNGGNDIFFRPMDKMMRGVPGKACVIAGRGQSLAIVGLGDDPDGGIPMTGLMLLPRNTWLFPRVTDMLDGVTSVVVTPGGSTVITDASTGEWYFIEPDGDFRDMPPTDRAGEAFVAGDRLYVTDYGLLNAPIRWSDDEGRTWHDDVLPGNESKQE